MRDRAYDLFSQHGFTSGHDLDDWLQAEHELSWPATELVEDDLGFQLKAAVPGYSAEQIKLTVTPQEIIVSASSGNKSSSNGRDPQKGTVRWSEFKSQQLCRRVELPSAINTDKVSATLQDGMLTVKATKVFQAAAKQAPSKSGASQG